MTTQLRTHDAYTVGWVCALSKEQTAATAMLDERHPNLPKPSNDPNTYTLGSINGHNVVIACLPEGKIGTNSAATVASHMVHAFPAIRFGLMVGIGGGMPSRVRLGDIIVSIPVDQYPGVVQWDLGKAEHGGTFRRTGALNNPPTLLLTALTRVKTDHELEGSKIPQYLKELAARYPRLAAKYLRSGALQDVLYKASYNYMDIQHQDDAEEGEEESEEEGKQDCRHYNKAYIIKRKPRDMRVHYGLITSGNRVIKDAQARDRLSKDLGNVLCVEIEAAGLMDNFPCIIIRGICDYADTHKNKAWQEHAAAVAAAFAKELLGHVVAHEVQGEKPVKSCFPTIVSQIVTSIQEDTSRNTHLLHRKHDMEILDWLSTDHYGPQQSDTLRRWHPETGQWFLRSVEYQDWLQTKGRTLYYPGIPGAGKTIMSSAIVCDIDRYFSTNPNVGLAYLYFTFSRQRKQTKKHVLASLLVQLLRGPTSLPDHIRNLSEHHQTKGTRPTHSELLSALDRVVSRYERVFIVLDALDECATEGQRRTKILSDILDIQLQTSMNVLATSRVHEEIAALLTRQNTITLPIIAHNQDMVSMLQSRIRTYDQALYDKGFRDLLISKVVRIAEGMFLLADLHLNALTALPTKGDVLDALSSLDKGSNPLNTVYELTMERIESQGSGFAQLAKKVLLWIVHAKRLLSSVEMRHALAVRPNTTAININYCPSIKVIMSICAGLVIVDEESQSVRLVHYTTQEYFKKTREKWFTNSQKLITESCVTYLSYQVFNGYCETDADFEKRLIAYPFYRYASRKWGHHAVAAINGEDIIEFLKHKRQVQASIQALLVNKGWSGYAGYSQKIPKGTHSLHLASRFGLTAAVKSLWTIDEVNEPDSYSQTPLSWAAQNGHKEVVQVLLDTKQVDADAKNSNGRTPLSWAAWNGYKEVVQVLLDTKQVDVDAQDNDGRTPLWWAAKTGDEHVLATLISSGADPVAADRFGLTAVQSAVLGNHESVEALLISVGASSEDAYGLRVLFSAVL